MTEMGFYSLDVTPASALADWEDKKANKRPKIPNKAFLHILPIYIGFNALVGAN